VSLKLVKRRSLTNSLQLFNVLFNKIFEVLKMVEIKRNYYDPTAKMMVPAHKLEIWPGYVNRVTETDGGLMLICDTRNKVLRKETAYDVIKDVQRKGGKLLEMEKALIGSVVMTEYNKASTYKIEDIDFDKSPLSTFTMYSGEEISFKDYYAKFYKLPIKDDKQPLLIHREKKKFQGEEQIRIICLIPELCRMTGLTDAMISDFRVMKDVAVHTRVTPEQRQNSLKKFLKNVSGNPECMELLGQWGLRLEAEPIGVSGRTLDSEKLLMGNNKLFTVNFKCDWGRESTMNTCLVPVHIKNWHVVTNDRNEKVVEGFIKLMKTLAPKMGINVGNPTFSVLKNDRSETFVQDIRSNVNENTQVVVAVVPQQREDRYATVKRLCNTDLPIASQVICSKTISNEKKVQSVVQKIILQINCKLGGELWGCKIPVQNFMVIGIDVYHDPARKKESVMGAVGSLNSTMSSWTSESAFQAPGQEIIDVMMTCVGNLIKKYKEINNVAPEKIILYRDGVGDGQIEQLDFYEAERCEKLFKILKIPVEFAFIVVQKRINRRLFRVEGNRYENPAPGSVLDHTVMKKNFLDFLLVSQHSSQSVVTPTHYIIVKNTTSFSVDQIQKISYKLTHQYFNWPGTIRVPAPCQYAHKLAYQIGEATRALPSPLLAQRLFFL
jgi:aubergine-like protein